MKNNKPGAFAPLKNFFDSAALDVFDHVGERYMGREKG